VQPRVYSYIRFSDAKQATGASVDRQSAYAERWAAEHGLQLDTQLSMRDEGLSAFHERHVKQGALGVFLKAVEDGHVARDSVLIVEGLDRLSRAEPIQAQAQLASIVNAGISVVTASDSKVYSRERLKANPMDLVYSLLVMIRAHEESDTKSKRVRDAIRRQCLGWQAGTYRGPIRTGNTPGWLQHVDGAWQLVPERAAAVRLVIDLAMQGVGLGRIARELHDKGLRTSDAAPNSGALSRLLVQPALMGTKLIELDGETHTLQGYFPALLDQAAWDRLQEVLGHKARRQVKGDIPSILTGTGISACGYCGGALKAQTMANKRRPDGSLADSHRRLQCVRVNSGQGCSVPGSCSAAPIERALIRFCSDLVNLQGLFRDDRSALPRAELAGARAELQRIEQQLARLTEALLASDAPPATFTRRARELETEHQAAAVRVADAEAALASAARADIEGADARWRAVAEGVEALDYAARMQARQLVADTFERIVVWMRGLRPAETPPGTIDVLLQAKGGTTRMLRIDKAGAWIAGEDIKP
jgi:DNA invertase Pin-like site-specific DNA recombinase